MTSSLVGSEMCIRDRSSSLPLPPLPVLCSTAWSAPVSAAMYTEPSPWACLLYTSDAADDM
eukprot:4027449-Prorocentrum_lima.AAC.1